MAFTAQLGTAESRLSNIVLGLGAASGTPSSGGSGVWEWSGTATGNLLVPTNARTTAISAAVVIGVSDREARTTAISAAAIVHEATRLARTTALSVAVIYQPLRANGTWEFGGHAVGQIPGQAVGEWEWGGTALGLVDSTHTATGDGDWEWGGEAEGRVTGYAKGAGVWEWGGTVTLPDGTGEECVTGDGTVAAPEDKTPNYVF